MKRALSCGVRSQGAVPGWRARRHGGLSHVPAPGRAGPRGPRHGCVSVHTKWVGHGGGAQGVSSEPKSKDVWCFEAVQRPLRQYAFCARRRAGGGALPRQRRLRLGGRGPGECPPFVALAAGHWRCACACGCRLPMALLNESSIDAAACASGAAAPRARARARTPSAGGAGPARGRVQRRRGGAGGPPGGRALPARVEAARRRRARHHR